MATIVLVRLIYMMCEMYIDDCIVFADTNDEFISRLDSVLGRFRKHNLFLKARTLICRKSCVRSRVNRIPIKNPSRPRFSITYRRQTTEEFFGYG